MAKKQKASPAAQPAPNVSEEEQVGFHKGALSTLAKEREEMLRIQQIVEQLMQMHVQALKELGIDLEEAAKKAKKQGGAKKKDPAKPIEDLLR